LKRTEKQTDAWRAAKAYGCNMARLEKNLSLTPAERVVVHSRALALYESLDAPLSRQKVVREIQEDLRHQLDPDRVPILQRFFKTGPGEYAEGDTFLGLTVPQLRALAKRYRGLSLREIATLLRSPIHEERLLALLLLVQAYRDGDADAQRRIYKLYLRSTRYINNWDLVDCSAEHIVGAFLAGRCSGGSVSRRLCRKENNRRPALDTSAATILHTLARSKSLWERRIAVLATFHFIKRSEFTPTLRIARLLLRDEHDLIHKAVGWMLREVGKRDLPAEEAFLRRHHRQMPRTMLRYAIERLPETRRQCFLKGTINTERRRQTGRHRPRHQRTTRRRRRRQHPAEARLEAVGHAFTGMSVGMAR
jgi:3-methyladenine DNA glycosylase AlkD